MRAVPGLVHTSHVPHDLGDGVGSVGVLRWSRVASQTVVICWVVNDVPTMMLFLQARIANIARALLHRTI